MTRASAMCQRRASISPPRKAAMPTMANRRPKVSILAKIFSAGVSGACRFMRGAAVLHLCRPGGSHGVFAHIRVHSLTDGSGPCIRLVGALVPFCSGFGRIMWDSGMCSISQQAPMTARTNHRMRLGRLHGGRKRAASAFHCFLTMMSDRYSSGRSATASRSVRRVCPSIARCSPYRISTFSSRLRRSTSALRLR